MTTFDVTVEMFVDGAWLDITRINDNCRVLSLDQGQRGITMTRGRSSEQGRVAPSTVLIDYLDTEAVLDWDNPNSAFWRKIGPKTPVRVKVDGDIRCAVELAALRPSWEDNSDNVQVQIEGAGVLRRLETQGKPLLSPLSRYFTRNPPWQWWPMETGSAQRVTTITSALTGGVALTASPASAGSGEGRLSGIISGGTTAGPDGSLSAVDSSGGGQLEAILPGSGTTGFRIEGCFRFDTPVSDDIADGENGQIFRTHFGAGNLFGLFHLPGIGLLVETYDPDVGPDSADNIAVTVDDGAWHHVRVDLTPSGGGADTACVVTIDGETAISTTFAGLTHGPITDLTISPTGEVDAVCHWAVWEVARGLPASATGSADAFKAYRGYTPISFMGLIAADEGVSFGSFGGPATTNLTLGPIGAGTFMDQIHEANKAAQGTVFEQRNLTGVLLHRSKDSLYNRVPAVRLTYGQLQPGFRPIGDPEIVNDMTATNPDGDSQRYVIPDGDFYHWSTEDPPNGAGMRDQREEFSTDGVADLDELAAWWAHLGSWREKRFPQVTVELAKDVFDADTRQAIADLEIGDVIAIDTTGAPKWVPYNEIRLMVQGYTEQASRFLHTFTFNTTPADVYEVSIVDSGSTSTLAKAIGTSDTTIKIAPGDGPAWSEADEPFHISIDGQPMTVTAITTDTPAFVAAGTAAHADNASVTPGLPAGLQEGDLLLLYAGIRNAGNGGGGPDVPDGYTALASLSATVGFTLCPRLFGKYAGPSEVAPTVTFTGGVAGATTSAQMCAIRGSSLTLDKNIPGGYPNGVVGQSNGSAQNIAYPAYLNRRTNSAMIILGWKADDWTSVDTIAGTTEIGEPDSTTGDDQGLVWAIYLPGTPTTVIAQSFVVNGGASAVSRSAVVGLRPLQTATVTRDIAGVLTAEAVGAGIHAWRPGAVAL